MLTKMTAAVKNSYGLIVGGAKSGLHGHYPSPRQMGDFIGRLHSLLKPDFVLMDAIVCMEGDGPSDGTPAPLGVLFAGLDAVAVDACACRAYGYDPTALPYLVSAAQQSSGIIDPSRITKTGNGWEIVENARLKRSRSDFLHRFPQWLFRLGTRFLLCKPEISDPPCIRCGKCAGICPGKAIGKNSDGTFRIDPKRCVLCVCCIEACPCHAIAMISPGMRFHRKIKTISRR
jgi:ferredoxin